MVRIDIGGRDPSMGTYVIRGIAMLAVAAVVLVLLMMRYQGKFDEYTEVTAQLNDVGDGLIAGADVRYNGLIVGSVDSIETTDGGTADAVKSVRINLDPDQAKGIPVNTTARTVPSNLFGVNSVQLLQPEHPSAERLRSGTKIPADTTEATIRLQDAQNSLRQLLQAVPAEDLGMVLGTIADALQGGGATFSVFVDSLNDYLKNINDQFPAEAPSGFGNFADAVAGLKASAPELLDTLGRSVVPAMTIAEKQRELTALLSAGQGVLDTTQTLFARNGDRGKRVVGDLNTTVGALVFEPDAMPKAIHELYVLAGRVLGVFTGTNGKVKLKLGVSFSAFERYSRQNCPVYNAGKYGQLRGPGCVGPGTGTGPTSSGPLKIYPDEGIQRREVDARVTTKEDKKTLNEALGREPAAADTLMLGPLVSGAAPTEEKKAEKKNEKQEGER